PAAHPIELRELAREQPWVAAERHHVCPEFQPRSIAGRERQVEQRITKWSERDIGQPEGIETEMLAGRDVVGKHILMKRCARRSHGESNSHVTSLPAPRSGLHHRTSHSSSLHRVKYESRGGSAGPKISSAMQRPSVFKVSSRAVRNSVAPSRPQSVNFFS